MRRMTGADALFLYNEVPTQHMHTLKVAIMDPRDDPAGYSFAAERQKLAARLHCVPPFRWRVVPTPLSLHHPLWVEDPDFDLDFHLKRAALPSPGGRAELADFVSELASRPLDRTRPMWELWMVEGLEDGCVAAVAKVHHSLADGEATADMLHGMMAPRPGAIPPASDWRPEAIPSRSALLRRGVVDLARFLRAGVPRLVRAVRTARRNRRRHADPDVEQPPRPFSAPDTSFNGLITARRRFTFLTLDLERVRRVRSASGATINDVVLTVVAGALRRYLAERGEPVDRPLVAWIPVSTRRPEEHGLYGNRVSVMYATLHVDVEDPARRLAATQRATAASKRDFEDTRGARQSDWLEFVPPPLAKLLFSRTSTLMKRRGFPSQANLIVSNVRGPRETLYYDRSRLRAFFSIGPIFEGIGLNITCWSYEDQLDFALLACPRAVPDLWPLTDGLRDALEDLVKAVEQRTKDG